MVLLLGRNKVLGQINKVEGRIWPSGLVVATCGIKYIKQSGVTYVD